MAAAVHCALHFLQEASPTALIKPQKAGLSKSGFRKCYFCFCQGRTDTSVTLKASLRVQCPCSFASEGCHISWSTEPFLGLQLVSDVGKTTFISKIKLSSLNSSLQAARAEALVQAGVCLRHVTGLTWLPGPVGRTLTNLTVAPILLPAHPAGCPSPWLSPHRPPSPTSPQPALLSLAAIHQALTVGWAPSRETDTKLAGHRPRVQGTPMLNRETGKRQWWHPD